MKMENIQTEEFMDLSEDNSLPISNTNSYMDVGMNLKMDLSAFSLDLPF